MVIILEATIASLPETVQYSTYVEKMISVIIGADFVKLTIVMITAKDMFQKDSQIKSIVSVEHMRILNFL